jgi:hypothetical protein
MFRKTYKIRRITVAIGLAASLGASAAQSALPFDGRSPDAREAAEQASTRGSSTRARPTPARRLDR